MATLVKGGFQIAVSRLASHSNDVPTALADGRVRIIISFSHPSCYFQCSVAAAIGTAGPRQSRERKALLIGITHEHVQIENLRLSGPHLEVMAFRNLLYSTCHDLVDAQGYMPTVNI